jgi:hypothetical protein
LEELEERKLNVRDLERREDVLVVLVRAMDGVGAVMEVVSWEWEEREELREGFEEGGEEVVRPTARRKRSLRAIVVVVMLWRDVRVEELKLW